MLHSLCLLVYVQLARESMQEREEGRIQPLLEHLHPTGSRGICLK